jgi:single-strand DNA-binding protein
MNQIILVGRLVQDVELRYIAQTGTPVGMFTIAVNREFTSKSGKRETDFIDIQVWGKQAENCSNYIGKGSLVSIQGSLRIERYDAKDGTRRTSARVNADRVNFLSTNRKTDKEEVPVFDPSFDPTFSQEFSAIDDDDCPF